MIDGQKLIPEVSLRRGEDENGVWWSLNGADITEEEHANIQNKFFYEREDHI